MSSMAAEATTRQRLFTVEEYHRMAEAGVFAPGERVELIRGVIREMSPKGRRHTRAVTKANRFFTLRLAGRAGTYVQEPLVKPGWDSEPEPDVVVASDPDPESFGTERTRALLVIEVADTSLDYDRQFKGGLYAEAEIPEYWIVNLVDDALEVYRHPVKGAYGSRQVLKPGMRVTPLAWPELEIEVSELIPA
jgi:Uma2 family endonuclease